MTSLLKNYIDCSEYNFVLVEAFTNAQDAIDYMQSHTVNAVITDINIPTMSGIDFAEYCNKNFPHTAVGFISAYRDFSYAYEVANLNCVGFILKPIVKSELKELCAKMKKYVDEHSPVQQNTNVLNFTSLHTQFVCQSIFLDMIYNNISDTNEINRLFMKEDINISCNMPCCVFEVSINLYFDFISDTHKHSSSMLYNAINTVIIRNYDNISVLPLLATSDKLLFVAIIRPGENTDMDALYDLIIKNVKYFLEIDIIIETLYDFDYLSDIIGNTAISSFDKNTLEYSTSEHLTHALQYIQDNIATVNSIDEVANYIHLSPAYFGRLFKKNMQKSFNSYLKEQKIEYSKILLKDKNLKLSSIASMIGYDNETYFYTVFKSIVGCTPTQYRNSLPD